MIYSNIHFLYQSCIQLTLAFRIELIEKGEKKDDEAESGRLVLGALGKCSATSTKRTLQTFDFDL